MSTVQIHINRRQYLELQNVATGVFAPLCGFMEESEFNSVVRTMRLPAGDPFPLPVVFDVTSDTARRLHGGDLLTLVFEGTEVGEIAVDSWFTCDKGSAVEKVYGTSDARHPGVAHFIEMGDQFVSGPARLFQRLPFEFSDYDLTPAESRAYFARQGWETVVGFQTRNVPHRAHEYLLRLALEQADGLFVQPLVGRKKRGDYTPQAILGGYRALIDHFLPSQRVLLGVLTTAMRYAGPREALFHAIIRRNFGCTHFVVGRDHAGVGDYYRKYEAHDLTREFDGELGIEILRFFGPFFCTVCDGIVTERTCPHAENMPGATKQISGTQMRALLQDGGRCPPELMRPEIVDAVRGVPIFIDEDGE